MISPYSQPRVAVSNDGDILIIQGSPNPIIFFPRTHVADLLEGLARATAVIICDVGAAAIETFLAAEASFQATTRISATAEVESVTIQLTLPNGLVCAWTSDDALAANETRLKALGIDLAVTDTVVNWHGQHAELIGEVTSNVPSVPPQFVCLQQIQSNRLAELVRDAISANKTSSNLKKLNHG